jgi:hypothetical protein
VQLVDEDFHLAFNQRLKLLDRHLGESMGKLSATEGVDLGKNVHISFKNIMQRDTLTSSFVPPNRFGLNAVKAS